MLMHKLVIKFLISEAKPSDLPILSNILHVRKINFLELSFLFVDRTANVTTISERLCQLRTNNDGNLHISENKTSSLKCSVEGRDQYDLYLFEIFTLTSLMALFDALFRKVGIDILWIVEHLRVETAST